MSFLMLVDDSRVMLKMIRRVIVGIRPDDEIILATSGEDAVEMAQSLDGPLAAALIDYNMKGIDGIECAAELRRLHPATKLALCTANTQDAVATRAREHASTAWPSFTSRSTTKCSASSSANGSSTDPLVRTR